MLSTQVRRVHTIVLMMTLAGALISRDPAAAVTVVLIPQKDNTLIESTSGALSNAKSDGIFSGRLASQGGGLRLRAVTMIDLTSIPVGSTVTSVSLHMILVQGNGGSQGHALYRMLGDWGEGTSTALGGAGAPSTPGDATWKHHFWNTSLWTALGGDFVATASASTIITNSSNPTWSSAGMVADVQFWVNNPASNFGWMIRGNENTLQTAKKLASKDGFNPPDYPTLTITYTLPPPPPCPNDIDHNGYVNTDDVLAVINAWGPCTGACPADVAPPSAADGDGIAGNGWVNTDDLLAVINAWGQCPH